MIDRDDLRAAVSAGTVSEAQAAALISLADGRRAGRAALRPGEEPFELFKGFNEIFIVVGLGILAMGWFGVWSLAFVTSGDTVRTALVAAAATLPVIALLAEYFVRRRRMVAPAIALTFGWVTTAAALWIVALRSFTVFGGIDLERAALPLLVTSLTVLVFWLRYRVPIAMACIAVTAFAALMVWLAAASGQDLTVQTLFRLSAAGPFAWATLVFGLVVFALAMRFDLSDRHRVGLRAANGFWLHVVAAPAIVNTLAISLLAQESPAAVGLLAALLAALAAIAVIIDRRSFLIAAIGYTVALITVVWDGGAWAILGLGAGLVALGAGWQRVRAGLMRSVPAAWRDRLPPSGLDDGA